MRIPIVVCGHCDRLFVLTHYSDGEDHCPDCYPNLSTERGAETPWKHLGWCDEGNLFIWHELQV